MKLVFLRLNEANLYSFEEEEIKRAQWL